MPLDATTLLILSVLFAATVMRSTFGFGDALVAMPLLTIFIDPKQAAPLVALASVTTAVIIMSREWRATDFRVATKLILASACGIPFGLWLLTHGDARIVKGLLAFVVLMFGGFHLFQFKRLTLHTDRTAPLFGVCAGVLGGAYNTHGPPLVMFGVLRHWSAPKFRATLQGYFLPVGGCVLAAHALSGLWTQPVLRNFGLSLPVVLVANLLGYWLHRSIDARRFTRAIYVILLAIGLVLLGDVLHDVCTESIV